jgi:branched-chain amino acid transport system permease protein
LDVPTFILFGVDIIRFIIDLMTAYALYLVVSLSLNLEAGFSGVPNFGKVMFVAAGAAVAGSVSGRLAALIIGVNTHGDYNGFIATIITQLDSSLSRNAVLSMEILLLGILLAAAVGAALGFLTSYPAIRLREDYLGMLLLASAQLFQIFLGGYEPLIGGTQGIEVPDLFGWVGNGIEVRDVVVLGFLAIFAVLVYFYAERVARSPLGRTLRAVRDNEVAARALGKDDVAIRRNVIIVASAISAMAGALLTFYVGAVNAETWTRITWTFWIWVMVIIGGAANNAGVALGAFSFTFLFKAVDQVKFYFQGSIPFDVNWLEYLMFASLLILILAFRPGGILPEKSSVTLPWRTVAEIMQPKSQVGPSSDQQQAVPNPAGADQADQLGSPPDS